MPPKAPRAGTTPATLSAMPTAKTIRGPVARWSNDEVDSLVLQLKEAKDEGNTSENGFKSTVWSTIAATFTDLSKKNPRVCETKWFRLKKDYKEVKFL